MNKKMVGLLGIALMVNMSVYSSSPLLRLVKELSQERLSRFFNWAADRVVLGNRPFRLGLPQHQVPMADDQEITKLRCDLKLKFTVNQYCDGKKPETFIFDYKFDKVGLCFCLRNHSRDYGTGVWTPCNKGDDVWHVEVATVENPHVVSTDTFEDICASLVRLFRDVKSDCVYDREHAADDGFVVADANINKSKIVVFELIKESNNEIIKRIEFATRESVSDENMERFKNDIEHTIRSI